MKNKPFDESEIYGEPDTKTDIVLGVLSMICLVGIVYLLAIMF